VASFEILKQLFGQYKTISWYTAGSYHWYKQNLFLTLLVALQWQIAAVLFGVLSIALLLACTI
jgi:hypothetical protein